MEVKYVYENETWIHAIGGGIISVSYTHLKVGSNTLIVEHIPVSSSQEYRSYKKDELEIGWGILAFFIPLAGWIMYFCWKGDTPHRESQAATWAWVGFGLGVFIKIL